MKQKISLFTALSSGALRGKTGFGGLVQSMFDNISSKRGGASGGAVASKQTPAAPRVDPRGVLPMNTMKNDRIAGLANSRMKRK